MQINANTNVTANPQAAAATTSSTTGTLSSASGQLMSEQDFLNLLVTQMTSQDPLNPMTNQNMLSQMVQFSTMQSNATLDASMSQMQSDQTLANADSLIGRQVDLQVDSNGNTAQGVVTGVDVSSGTPQIVVNGQAYSLSQVLAVTTASSQTTSSQNTSS